MSGSNKLISFAALSSIAVLTSVPGLSACGGNGGTTAPDAGADSGAPVCTGDLRATSRIYYGTEAPLYVPLTPGQVLAIGALDGCSGTLIAPTWILTAAHCQPEVGDLFCVGSAPGSPDQCMQIIATARHPSLDIQLAELGVDATVRVPGIEPIPIATAALDNSAIGTTAEAAGYGGQEDGSDGEREFTAEPIVALDNQEITIDGEGKRGACFGDSGGPLMIIASDDTVRVAGDLSWGDQSCTGEDHYARVDQATAWIESYTGPTLVGDGPYACDSIDVQGRCMGAGSVAMWCGADSALQRESCAAGSQCGWDDGASGYRCITGADSCGGVDEFGSCEGQTARWCENGSPKSRNCGSCGELCALGAAAGGAHCITDPCIGVDYLGRCVGDTAQWCEGGELQTVECTDDGQTCGYIDDQTGYYCQ